jgi:hypothetical protein
MDLKLPKRVHFTVLMRLKLQYLRTLVKDSKPTHDRYPQVDLTAKSQEPYLPEQVSGGVIAMNGATWKARAIEWASHFLAYAFALHFLFGTVAILNALGLGFFFYYPRKIDIILVDPRIDVLVWVASVACLSILAIWFSSGRQRRVAQVSLAILAIVLSTVMIVTVGNGFLGKIGVYMLFIVGTAELVPLIAGSKPTLGPSRNALASRLLIYLLGSLAAIESSSAIHYVLQSFDQGTQIGGVDAGIELQLSYAPYALIPLLYVAFLFSWAWVPLVRRLLPKKLIARNPDITSTNQNLPLQSLHENRFTSLLDPRILLALALAVFIGYYPYFQNPPWLVGTDANWRYYYPLLRMNAMGIFGGFVQALGEWHPMSLALMYAVQLIFQSTAFEVVRLTPLFLAVTLGLAMWWFLGRKKGISLGLLVFALSVLSVTTTVGFYASILANWMALLVWVVFFAYVAFRGDEGFRIIDLIVLLALSTLLLFIHPWTWGVFAATVLLAAIVALFQERRRGLRGAATLVSVIVIDLFAALLSLVVLGGSTRSNLASALQLYGYVMRNPSTLTFFWGALTRLTQIWAPFFSPLYLAVSILGVLSVWSMDLAPWRRRLILAWICVSAIGSVLVAPIGFTPTQPTASSSELWRLLFLTPFQLTAPFGITWLAERSRRIPVTEDYKQSAGSAVGNAHVVWLVAIFVIGVLLAWTPAGYVWLRFLLLLLFLPATTALLLQRGGGVEREFLSTIILATFLLVAFNSTTRAVSQLLVDPHNCNQC